MATGIMLARDAMTSSGTCRQQDPRCRKRHGWRSHVGKRSHVDNRNKVVIGVHGWRRRNHVSNRGMTASGFAVLEGGMIAQMVDLKIKA